ncbi:MAG TPA: DUF116 domain-containing protein [bacterium]|nr:DUF116 domain-containing protein [bacterium]
MLDRFIIFLNKAIGKLRTSRAKPSEILVLLPHCIQNKDCDLDLTSGVQICRRCGRCKIREVSLLQEEYGFRSAVVGGGQQAVQATKDKGVKCVVAIACEKELAAGILSVLRKPVHTIRNSQPFGPCVNTDMDADSLREMLQKIVKR